MENSLNSTDSNDNNDNEKKKLNDEDDRRPARKRSKPERLGSTSSDYNEFMAKLDEIESANSKAATKTTSTPTKATLNTNGDCTQLLQLLFKKIDAIENHLIKLDVKISHLNSTRKVSKLGNVDYDQLKQFGLPLDTEIGLENLDKRLKNDADFKSKLLICMQHFGGDGNSDGEEVLEEVVSAIISPPYLKDISWTGRGKQKERKVALSKFHHVIDFIKSVTIKADKSFTEERCKHVLIYDILKRAPSKYGANNKSDDKENVGERAPPLTKESNSDSIKSTLNRMPNMQPEPMQQQLPVQQPPNHPPSALNPTPSIQPAPMQQQLPVQQLPNHYPPSNAPPPVTYYPPPQSYQFGDPLQLYHQQQPYYYNQHTNVNGLIDTPWQTGVPPTTEQPPPESSAAPTYTKL